MTLRALVFDVDGTLAETEELHRTAFNLAFQEASLGWHWTRDVYRELLKVTGGKERMEAHASRICAPPVPNVLVAEIHRRKTELYGVLVAEGRAMLRPGIAELIDRARSVGLRLAVAATTSLPNVEALCLGGWGRPAAEVFDVLAAGDEVPAKKPFPDVYQLALRRLGIGPPEALAFEDSSAGVASARAAGLRVVAAPSVYTAHHDLSEADLVVPDLASPLVGSLVSGSLSVATSPERSCDGKCGAPNTGGIILTETDPRCPERSGGRR